MKKILLLLTAMVFATGVQASWYDHNDKPKATAISSANATAKQLQAQHQSQSQQQYVGNNNNAKAYGGQGGQGGDGGTGYGGTGIGQGGNANSSAHASGGDAYAKGGNAGALAGSNSGGNSQDTNITIEGDEADKFPVSSAIAGNASDCVEVLAAQAQNGGFSIGGASAECQAEMASRWFYEVGDKYRDSDPDKASKYYTLGDKWAEKAAPGSFQSAVRDTKETMIDFGVIALIVRAAVVGF